MAVASLLIVDDEAAQLLALSDTLRQQGYEVVGASSGDDALTSLRQRAFDLMLSDLQMPGMDGIELLRQALAIDSNLVAILMTGNGTIATAVEAMQVGALDYVLKPFKLSAVLPVLARGLAVRRLRIANAELEKRVRERTQELEAVNRDLDDFAFSVSHDLRAPLQLVIGFSEMLSEDYGPSLSPKVREVVDHITRAGKQGAQIIEDLLRFSHLGRQPLMKQTIDVNALVEEIVAQQRLLDPGRDVQVAIGDLPPAVADAALLRHVFDNLLSNAFKFTRKQSLAKISVESEIRDGTAVYVIRDNGAGFDMKYADKLFGVFQRLHPQEEFGGTGVGLSLVNRIVQRHGGRAWADAEPGKGATFFFTLGS